MSRVKVAEDEDKEVQEEDRVEFYWLLQGLCSQRKGEPLQGLNKECHDLTYVKGSSLWLLCWVKCQD